MSKYDDYSAVRTIAPKTIGNRGYFPSSKVASGVVAYESQIERDFYLLLDHAPDIEIFQPQPFKILFEDKEGKSRSYTPDVYVRFTKGIELLVEIKDYETYQKIILLTENPPTNPKQKEKQLIFNKEKWEYARNWAEQKGYYFTILTEYEIRNPRMLNIWFILGASKAKNGKFISNLQKIINRKGKPFNELCKDISDYFKVEIGKASQILCYAIYHGYVFVEAFSTKLISEKTLIRKKKSKFDIPFQSLWEEIDSKLDEKFAVLKRPNRPNSGNNYHASKTKLQKTTKIDSVLEKKLEIINVFNEQPSYKRNKEWRDNFKHQFEISYSTVSRWVNNYENYGIEGLKPGYHKSGRKSPYDQQALDFLEKARNEWLKITGTFNSAYKKLEDIWDHDTIKLPSKPLLRKYISNNTTYSDRIVRRYGKTRSNTWLTPSLKQFSGAIMPMQVLQFDNTSFDVFISDKRYRKSIGTPYLTASIDCYTRMITGFALSINPSSKISILETLAQSILPKDDYIKKYEEILDVNTTWDIRGYPVLILVDNGMDYRAKDVKLFCLKYDIILEFAPIKRPRYKAIIETWFKTLTRSLKNEKINGYRPQLKERLENPDLKPEEYAVLTIQELNKALHSWILDTYHIRNQYFDKVPAPQIKLENMQFGYTPIILPMPREPPKDDEEIDYMLLDCLDHFTRKLTNDGIQWEYLLYNSEELANLYHRIGEGITVNVIQDRRDIRNIWVEDDNGKPVEVGLGRGWAAAIAEVYGDYPIHSSAWISEIKSLTQRNRERISPFQFRMRKAQRNRIELYKLASTNRKKMKRKRRETERMKENSENKVQERLKSVGKKKVDDSEKNNKIIKTRQSTRSIKKKKRLSSDDVEVLNFEEKRRV